MTGIAAEFTLSRAEYVRASRAIQNRRWVTRLVYWFFGLYLVGVLALQVWLRTNGRGIPWHTFLGVMGTGAIILLITYFWPWLYVQDAFRNHSTAFTSQEWSIGEAGLRISGPDHSGDLSWTAVRRVVEDDEFFYFHLSDAQALILPKRALSPESSETLRQGVQEWRSNNPEA